MLTTDEVVNCTSHGLLAFSATEPFQFSDTEGNYGSSTTELPNPSHASQLTHESEGVIHFDPDRMEEGTPYPFRLAGSWFVALKRPAGHLDFFSVK